jgi:hypothetical protein
VFLSSRKYDPGCSSRIRILIFYPSRIPDPGVKKAPDPGSATLCATYCIAFILQGRDPLRECRAHRRDRDQEAEEAEGGHQQGRRQEVEIDTSEDENLSLSLLLLMAQTIFCLIGTSVCAHHFFFLYSRFLFSQKSPVFIKHCPPPRNRAI